LRSFCDPCGSFFNPYGSISDPYESFCNPTGHFQIETDQFSIRITRFAIHMSRRSQHPETSLNPDANHTNASASSTLNHPARDGGTQTESARDRQIRIRNLPQGIHCFSSTVWIVYLCRLQKS
jgi:hypothetical protein